MASYTDILNKAAKEWNCPDLLDRAKNGTKKIPFSSPQLNYSTYGGVPIGMISEFCGEEGGGKTSTAIDVAGNAVKLFNEEYEAEVERMRELIASGKKEYAGPLEDLIDAGPKRVCFWDLEHSFDYKWAKKMGVNSAMLDVVQPPNVSGEQILQKVEDLVCTGQVGLLIIDSVPSLTPQSMLEKKYGERTVAALAGLMTTFMIKMTPICAKYDCALLLINQTRDNQDNPYAIQTPGGRAIKFYSALRLYFRRGKPLDFAGNELPMNAEDPKGFLIDVKLLKHKAGSSDRRKASYYLMFESGIRPDFDYVKLAIERYGIIRKTGGWYTLCNPATGEILEEDDKPIKINGLMKVYQYLQTHHQYYLSLCEFIDQELFNQEDEDEEEGTDGE